MALDPATELSLLETAYQSLLTGGVKTYTIDGRSITRNDIAWMAERMDILRVVVARQTQGGVRVASFRPPE